MLPSDATGFQYLSTINLAPVHSNARVGNRCAGGSFGLLPLLGNLAASGPRRICFDLYGTAARAYRKRKEARAASAPCPDFSTLPRNAVRGRKSSATRTSAVSTVFEPNRKPDFGRTSGAPLCHMVLQSEESPLHPNGAAPPVYSRPQLAVRHGRTLTAVQNITLERRTV